MSHDALSSSETKSLPGQFSIIGLVGSVSRFRSTSFKVTVGTLSKMIYKILPPDPVRKPGKRTLSAEALVP